MGLPSGFTLHLDEKLCTSLVNAVRAIVWEADAADFRFFYVSPQAEQILGYPVAQWLAEPDFWRTHLHPDDLEQCVEFCREATARHEDHEIEYRMIAADGTVVSLHDIVTVIKDENGGVRLRGIMLDITESTLTKQQLQAGEERFRLAIQGANDGIWDWDLSSDDIFYSPRWKSMLGYRDDELENNLDTAWELIHPEDRDRVKSQLQSYLDGHSRKFETEFRMRHRNGSYLTIFSRGLLARNDRGEPTRMAGTHVDLTPLKQAEEGLLLARTVLDKAPVGFLQISPEGRVLDANEISCSSLGYSREELCTKSIFDFDPEANEEMWPAFLEQLREAGAMTIETTHVARNGRKFPMEISAAVLELGGREFIYSFEKDISERRKTELALAESEARYRQLVELSPDSIYIFRDNRFVFMNVPGAELLGARRPEELYGRYVLDFVHADYRAKVAQRIDNAEGHRKNPPMEMTLLRTDRSQVPVEMVSVYFSYQDKDSVLAVARDISERKRMQEELVKAQRLESLGVLAGGIAHDFNNILTGILGNISLMRCTLDPVDAMADRLKSCEQAAIRASELTQQLLTFARGGAPVKKLMDPRSLIRESATFLLHGSNIGCTIKLAEDLWHIRADSGQISQVLHNILFNAMQAMPDGGQVFISAGNRHLQRPNAFNLPVGDYLQIEIEDQGCGIPPENLPKIFDPYFSTKSEGNGLGLASVYSVIKRHGGAIDVNSTVGVGTRFSLFLPAITGELTGEAESEKTQSLRGSGRILVMDDEQIIREVAGEILTISGFEVETCADGREAVQRYRQKFGGATAYDAVVMDLTIPGGMGGREAAVQILEIDPEAVLIVSSGYSNDPVVAEYRRFGFRGVVIKPFAAETLVSEVRRLVSDGGRDASPEG